MEVNKIINSEIKNFVNVWLIVFASLTYCYFISSKMKKGKIRLLSILPIISIFIFLPLNLHSIHLGGTTGLFIGWLANFKLLLFAFGLGPLLSDPSLSSLLHFISIACLPIKIQQNPYPNIKNKGSKSTLNYAIKFLIIALMIRTYDYKQHMHAKLILVIYCFHIYFALEIMLAMVSALAQSLLGLKLEPQFNEPYLSTSLQDFWGKRWKLMFSGVLRPTIYEPVRTISRRIIRRKWAMHPAILVTFAVSGLMHELIFFYLGRVWPTWEAMCFFVLHGLCLSVEIAVKIDLQGRWQLHRAVSISLTIGFMLVTSIWLLYPQFLRCSGDVRGIREYAVAVVSVKNMM